MVNYDLYPWPFEVTVPIVNMTALLLLCSMNDCLPYLLLFHVVENG